MSKQLEVSIISGIYGQDGRLLAHQVFEDEDTLTYCLGRGTERTRVFNLKELSSIDKSHLEDNKYFVQCDFKSKESIDLAVKVIDSHVLSYFTKNKAKYNSMVLKVYHFAALSHVHESYDAPIGYLETNTLGSTHFYLAVDKMQCAEHIRTSLFKSTNKWVPINKFFYHAATTELFSGDPRTAPQNSSTPFEPKTPYAVSKMAAYYMLDSLSKRSDVQLRQAIISNHESQYRPMKFVTAKVVSAVAKYYFCKISEREFPKVPIGNLGAKRDWGWAPEYVDLIRKRIMTPACPTRLVIGTGVVATVADFIRETIDCAHEFVSNLPYDVPKPEIEDIFEVKHEYIRDREVHHLEVDTREAFDALGWKARYNYKDVARMMLLEISHLIQYAHDEYTPADTK